MVGGEVAETIPTQDGAGREVIWVNCRGKSVESGEECAVYVEYAAITRCIEPGDILWWQGGRAYWTPKSKAFREKPVKRIGYSGVPKPTIPA